MMLYTWKCTTISNVDQIRVITHSLSVRLKGEAVTRAVPESETTRAYKGNWKWGRHLDKYIVKYGNRKFTFSPDCPLVSCLSSDLVKMNMRRVIIAWVLLLSGIIFADLSSSQQLQPNNPWIRPSVSVTVSPNLKMLFPNRGGPVAASGGNQGKIRKPVVLGAISRDEWLAKEYFGYLCGEYLLLK